jgi:hypothetical protein
MKVFTQGQEVIFPFDISVFLYEFTNSIYEMCTIMDFDRAILQL